MIWQMCVCVCVFLCGQGILRYKCRIIICKYVIFGSFEVSIVMADVVCVWSGDTEM